MLVLLSSTLTFTAAGPGDAYGAAAAAAGAGPRRQLQQESPACGGVYAVSLPADVADLADALASCTGGSGGEFDVTWTGTVVLDAPLAVPAGSSLTITGATGAAGGGGAAAAAAVLDGGGVTGLVDLATRSSLRLEGVTLRNARRETANGAAVRAEAVGCSVVAFDSIFEGNNASYTAFADGGGRGGALSLGGGATAELEDCVISGNHASYAGGGVWIEGDGCSLELTRCVLEDNTAEYQGGAVALEGRSAVVLEGSAVSRNHAFYLGGGLHGLNATVVIAAGSDFVNNTAGEDMDGFGGGFGGGLHLLVRGRGFPAAVFAHLLWVVVLLRV